MTPLSGPARCARLLLALALALLVAVPAWALELVLARNFPDPDVLATPRGVYLYATAGNGKHLQIARRGDDGVIAWLDRAALPVLPDWVDAARPSLWAPAVARVGGCYLMYYTAGSRAAGRQCIGVAAAAQPEGPFADVLGRPLVCPVEEGGAIDAAVFRGGGALYLLWKTDGNCCNLATRIMIQPLTEDGLALRSQATELLRNETPEEEGVVEAPLMWRGQMGLYLLYSSGRFGGAGYRLAWARCDGPLGPCRKEGVLLASGALARRPDGGEMPLIGPGSAGLQPLSNGRAELYFHAWKDASARTSGTRWLLRGRLAETDDGSLHLQ